MISNPIIKGFNPDPSICFADGVYYTAVSTFEYQPGVAVYSSTDLVNWKFCTSILSRPGQLNLDGCKNSGGIYAPTLRHHNGRFYMVTTNKNIPSNFIVHSDSITGEWSDPLPVSPIGIDPSLFFDEDGSCYYSSNGEIYGRRGILGARINPDTGELLEPLKNICDGVVRCATEAPHIYKKDGWYYLVIAEGGTEMGHHARVYRSPSLEDGFTEFRQMPILSHVYRKGHPIQAVGHADLIELDDGSWYAVFLGIRPPGRAHLHNLGRETFLAPVSWWAGWPVIGNGGSVELDFPELEAQPEPVNLLDVDFSHPLEEYPFLRVRSLKEHCYKRSDGNLTLTGEEALSAPTGTPTMIALRQREFECSFTAELETGSLEGRAGLVAWYNSDYFLKLQVEQMESSSAAGGAVRVSLVRCIHGYESPAESIILENPGDSLDLKIQTDREFYLFYCGDRLIGRAAVATLCTETTMYMTFTGTLLGLWAEEGRARFRKGCRLEDFC